MKVLRLPRAKVAVGRPLPWNVRDESGLLLLSKGHIVENEQQLDTLLERGAFVDVEEIRASAAQASGNEVAQTPAYVLPPNLFGLWDKTSAQLQALLTRSAEPDFVAQVAQYAQDLIALMDVNPDIALYRCVRQDNVQHYWYGYAHSVHTAVLCVLMARQLAWPQSRCMSLVHAALTMNLSILELQGQMAGQDTPVKEKQAEKIRAHPQAAVDALLRAGVRDQDWLDAIAQHHERSDGSGYPKGLTALNELAVALRVADVFMAKISPRALREALTPQAAVRQLYTEDGGGALSTAVVKQFGLYPPGDYVRLASGEQAVVVQRTANAKAPIVAAITDAYGQSIVRTLRRDTSQSEFAIVGTVADRSALKRLAPERLYGLATVAKA